MSWTTILGILLIAVGVVLADILVTLAMERAASKLYMALAGGAMASIPVIVGGIMVWHGRPRSGRGRRG